MLLLMLNETTSAASRPTGTLTPSQYIAFVKPFAQTLQDATGIPMVASIAQSGLETGWGNSDACTKANNYFGITKGNWSGLMYGNYRQYDTPAAGWADYGNMITEDPIYGPALDPLTVSDPGSYINALVNAGYNSADSSYATDVQACFPLVKQALGL